MPLSVVDIFKAAGSELTTVADDDNNDLDRAADALVVNTKLCATDSVEDFCGFWLITTELMRECGVSGNDPKC